jgi:Spy/CpxP family protein refolding chaperone
MDVGVRRLFKTFENVVFTMSLSNAPFTMALVYLAASTGQRVNKEFGKMRRVLLYAALVVAIALSGGTLQAQMQDQAPGPGPGGMRGHPPSSEERLQRLTQQLNLTSEQQQQIKPILENEVSQMQSAHQDNSLSQQDRMAKMQQIQHSAATQIKPILNPEQQTKFDQMMSHQGGHGRSGRGQAPPPDQQNPQ